jgi:hypothetical protein
VCTQQTAAQYKIVSVRNAILKVLEIPKRFLLYIFILSSLSINSSTADNFVMSFVIFLVFRKFIVMIVKILVIDNNNTQTLVNMLIFCGNDEILRVTVFKSQVMSITNPKDHIIIRLTSESRKEDFSCFPFSVFGKDKGIKPNIFDTKNSGL